MTPTLNGRIQTRIIILATVGLLWTLLITLALPGSASLGDKYQVTLRALAVVIIVGIGWEILYHGLQQFRWEKDWPTLFGLLVGINEGIVAWFVLKAILPDDLGVTGTQFSIHFVTTWIVIFLFLNGPMRVMSLRWRFRGGRLV
jgi:hypothetical protein